ncbi:MAG TPA: N-acetylmuramoyl-L-alanine amidase-like domain-containing protein [Pseudolabrys sp.]|nr:N-acetylmuramoyl-L-alanine amidase-like domain-containing protein [Pseudolabrys sp.]
MPFDSPPSRRHVLQMLAGATALAAGSGPSLARAARIERLIGEARGLEHISQRIDFISGALRGTRYQGYTLIGGPRRPEQFVVRDDGFDCVTFCETVLAAAIAHDIGEFETALREIRYRNGIVNWFERNHYFFEWGQHNVANKTCRWIGMEGAIDIEKTVDSQKGLSKRHFSMRVIPSVVFLMNKAKLENGDIVGFVSRRPNLDYFHAGFVAFAPDRTLLLRHASESRRRVLDERMDRFVARYRVRYVTLLRPEQPAAAVAVKKAI